uniref:site-specific integrase n=1 Tax=Daejeonella sp. TaxID=2805397 RepID=UPI004049C5D6
MDWQSGLTGFKSYLRLERSLSANTVEAYMHDVEKLHQFFISTSEDKKLNSITS